MAAARTPSTSTTSDRSPRPAPPLRRILAHAELETRILLSNGEQLTVAVVLPAMVLIGLWLLPLGRIDGVPAVDTAVAATFATALISTSFTSQAILTGFDRRNGVLRWVATSPLGRGGYLAGKILATLATHVLQVLVLGVIALMGAWGNHVFFMISGFYLIPSLARRSTQAGYWPDALRGTVRRVLVIAVSVVLVAVVALAFDAWVMPLVNVHLVWQWTLGIEFVWLYAAFVAVLDGLIRRPVLRMLGLGR